MPHYEGYESTQTKKSKEKKERAKAKSADRTKIEELDSQFVIKKTIEDTGIVIETRYNDATVLYKGDLISAHLKKEINAVCNQILYK